MAWCIPAQGDEESLWTDQDKKQGIHSLSQSNFYWTIYKDKKIKPCLLGVIKYYDLTDMTLEVKNVL